MKVIFAASYLSCQNPSGGVQNRLRKIASLLNNRGIKVELFNPFETKLEPGDILHVFKLSIDICPLIRYAKTIGVKIVISTVIPLEGENKLSAYKVLGKFIPITTSYKIEKSALLAANVLITESQNETDFITKYYGVDISKLQVIPNGVDIDCYDGDDIYKAIGKKCRYVLQVGRFDKNKNQMNIIKALKNSSIDLVFIGGPGFGLDEYYRNCKEEAKNSKNIHFLGWVDSDSKLLKSAYSHADTLILPSFFETFGLVAIEGASKGAKLALSNTIPLSNYSVFRNCRKFSPSSVTEIKEAIDNCFNSELEPNFTQNVIKAFNWDAIIDAHINIYNSL